MPIMRGIVYDVSDVLYGLDELGVPPEQRLTWILKVAEDTMLFEKSIAPTYRVSGDDHWASILYRMLVMTIPMAYRGLEYEVDDVFLKQFLLCITFRPVHPAI